MYLADSGFTVYVTELSFVRLVGIKRSVVVPRGGTRNYERINSLLVCVCV